MSVSFTALSSLTNPLTLNFRHADQPSLQPNLSPSTANPFLKINPRQPKFWGLLAGAAAVVGLIDHFVLDNKLSKPFGLGQGTGITIPLLRPKPAPESCEVQFSACLASHMNFADTWKAAPSIHIQAWVRHVLNIMEAQNAGVYLPKQAISFENLICEMIAACGLSAECAGHIVGKYIRPELKSRYGEDFDFDIFNDCLWRHGIE